MPAWLRAFAASGSARRFVGLLLLFSVAKLMLVALRALDHAAAGLLSGWAPLALLFPDAHFALGFLAADLLVTRSMPGKIAERVFRALYAAVALYTAANVPIARVFSTPLTHGLLGAAGGALSESILAYVSVANVTSIALVFAAAFVAPRWLRIAPPGAAVALGAALLLSVTGPFARRRCETLGMHRNALYTIVKTSLVARSQEPSGASTQELPPLPDEGPGLDLSHLRGAAEGRNVVWIVLESTGARYLKPWGAERDATPRLTEMASRGLVFSSVYAAYPESIRGLFAMLCASSPAAHLSAEQHGGRRARCGSFAETLAARGYRTALMHSGRFAYLGMDAVIAERGFHSLEDAETIGGPFVRSFGTDDASTVRRLLSWVDGLRPGEPFFAMYLPIAGHHPYRAPGKGPRPFPEKTEQDRYLNDLYMGDAVMGELIDGLRARGLEEKTLFVIVGDHGEAFQQHPGNFAHTMFIYDENVHVPLIIAAPGALNGSLRAPRIGSVIDIVPTLLDLLGLPPQPAHEGRSLLSSAPGVARFYTDQTLFQVGLRQGFWKYILEVERGTSKLYFLPDDPGEQRSVADAHPERVERYKNHLLRWVDARRARVAQGQ